MAKMTLEDLRKLRESKKIDLRKRDTDGKAMQIIVGMGTCGIAAGAKSTLDEFIKLLDAKNLADGVLVRQTGCMGLCHSEPTVEVVVPGMPTVIYGKVAVSAVKDIVETHLVGRRLLDNMIIDRPAPDLIDGK